MGLQRLIELSTMSDGSTGLHPGSFSAEEWNRVPLNRLEPPVSGGRTGTFLTTVNRSNYAPLPSSPTTLIGREWAVRLLCERLRQPEVRLLTLLGTGGVGKTRLSL